MKKRLLLLGTVLISTVYSMETTKKIFVYNDDMSGWSLRVTDQATIADVKQYLYVKTGLCVDSLKLFPIINPDDQKLTYSNIKRGQELEDATIISTANYSRFRCVFDPSNETKRDQVIKVLKI